MLRFFLGTPKFSLIFFLSSFLGCLGSSTVYSAENPDSRPKLKILVLGPFESAMANYKNTGDEMRSKTVGIFMSHTSGKFQFISGNLALAPLRKLPEAKGIDFTYYDHYHLLTENNFRLARKFGKVHGANFVVVMARDGLKGKHGGKAYLSFVDVDVEDEQHSYSGSRLRGRGDAPVFTLFKKFLLLSRKGIEQALARKQSPGKGVQKSTRQNVEKKGSVGVTVQKSGEQNQNVAFELAFWDAIKYSKSSGDYRAYLEKYPNGQFASLAIFRLNKYSKVANPPTKTSPTKTKLPNLYDRLGRYHALVIGNNKYRNISKLKTAVNDARAVAQVLEQDYGFQVKLLIDATRYQILAALSRLRAKLTERDNLLVYYAGHGFLDKAADAGYWLPVDADKDITANWIGTHDLTTTLRAMNAKHIMIVADSCYSGTLIRSGPAQLKSGEDRLAWIKRMQVKRSRTVLTSGGLEPVVDGGGGSHSVFAKAFLDVLHENEWVMGGQKLFSLIQRPVVVNSRQTPEYSDIRETGHEGGDFLFVKKP